MTKKDTFDASVNSISMYGALSAMRKSASSRP